MAIIYKITNTTNNKAYIGATIHSLEDRWGRHLSSAFNDNSSMAIHKALRKYGKEAFKIEILHEDPDSNHVFDVLEPKYIQEHKTYGNDGYNMTLGGDGWLGMNHSEETKEKLRKGSIGRKMSEETKKKISKSLKGKETWNKGKKAPQCAHWTGKEFSEETCKKISKSIKGRQRPESQKESARFAISETHIVQKISTGEILEIYNLSQFCKDNNLSQGNLKAFGKTKDYKMISTTKKVRKYVVEKISTGEIVETDNLKKFCEMVGLDNSVLLNSYKRGTFHKDYRIQSITITEVVHKY